MVRRLLKSSHTNLHPPFLLRRLTTAIIATHSHPNRPFPLGTPPLRRQQQENPHDLLKEDPIDVISGLWIRSFSRRPTFRAFPNLTGFLKKLDLWVLAYQRSCAHFTGSFPAKPSIAVYHLRSLLSLRDSVLRGDFRWGASTSQLIRSPSDRPHAGAPLSKRKLLQVLDSGEPLFQDRVVQELLLLLLEPLFEPRFSQKSHGFRPGRSAHTVIRTIRSNFAGHLWFIKADLSAVSDNLPLSTITDCLEKGVLDRKVLSLIRSAIKTPLKPGALSKSEREGEGLSKLAKKRLKRKAMRLGRKKKLLKEGEPKPDPYWLRVFYSFAPDEASKVPDYGYCGILSPLLINVCLNELDSWMEDRIASYFRPSKLDSIWRDSTDDGCHNPSWPEFVPATDKEKSRKMDYIRYGTYILIGIRGPREDAVQIRKELIEYCEEKYGVKLDNTKVEIEHITRGIQFLDHVISRRVIYPTLHYTATGGKIVSQKGVGTLLSVTANLKQCISQFRRLNLVKGDKDPEPLPCVAMFYSGQAHTNAQMNKFLETMADWYKFADNRKKVVGFCAYVIRSSLAKLYAARYRLKSRAKVYKMASRDLSKPLIESTRKDAPEYSDLLRMGLVDAIDGVQFSHMSVIPSCDYTPFPRNWIPDHEKVFQDYIRLQDPKFFYKLYKSVKRQNLVLPQDDMSMIVWDCKQHGLRSSKFDNTTNNVGNSSNCAVNDTGILITG